MKRLLFSVVAILIALPAHSAFSPISVGIVYPVQFPPSDFTVTGVRASAIFGRQRDVYGIDLGLVGNITDLTFAGVAASGVFNLTKGTTMAFVQLAGITNMNYQKTTIIGVQAAAGLNRNVAESKVGGLQLALVNLADHTTIYGVQAGVYNEALTVRGFQIGLINKTENLTGIQIGLLNYYSKGLFSVAPVLNVGF